MCLPCPPAQIVTTSMFHIPSLGLGTKRHRSKTIAIVDLWSTIHAWRCDRCHVLRQRPAQPCQLHMNKAQPLLLVAPQSGPTWPDKAVLV